MRARRPCWASTRAAAEHLKDDYAALQDWPLVVTAYNFGRSGVLRALKETGGSSLEDLLARHRSKRFGFASRNFYAEFLAATDVERDWREHYGDIERGTLLRFDAETIAHYTPWRTLQRLSGADEETFRRLNPAYRPEVIAGKLYVPAGDAIRLPAGAGAAFRTAYAGLGSGETFARQREMFSAVKVKKGDTLSVLAKRHGVSTRTLKAVNGLKGDRVRAGQRLLIPTDGNDAPPPDAAEPARRPAQTARASSRVHRVKAGQSLSVIAARYDTTVAQLVRLNDLRSAQHIRAGMKLKVPG